MNIKPQTTTISLISAMLDLGIIDDFATLVIFILPTTRNEFRITRSKKRQIFTEPKTTITLFDLEIVPISIALV